MDRLLLKEIRNQQFSPVYFLYGEEAFLIKETVEWIRKQLKIEKDHYGYVYADLTETSVQDLVVEAETSPFLSDHRLIIGTHAEFLTAGKTKMTHETDALVRYLEHPLKTSTMILTLASDRLDKRKKIGKILQEKSRVAHFPKMKGKELVSWLQKRFRQYQVQADEQTIKRLILFVGNDLRQLDQECQKCSMFVGKGGKVSTQVIDQLVPRSLEQDVFKLMNRIVTKDMDKVFQIWMDLISQQEEPIRILALIIRQLRLMLHTQWLSKQGKSAKEMASILKVHPYPVKLAYEQGSPFSERELSAFLSQAIQIDQEIKSGRCEKKIAVERFLFSWGASLKI